MPTTALIAAGVGAAGSIGAAAIGANAQTNAAKSAIAVQSAMLDKGYGYANNMLTGAQDVLNPFIAGGQSAMDWYKYLTGTGTAPSGATGPASYNPLTAPLTAPFSAAMLPSTPGYQFTLGQGLKSTQNSYAAEGLGSSGASEKGAAQFATGLAQNTYNQQFQNYLAQNAQIGNLLYQPAAIGAGAAGSLAGIEGMLGQAGLGAAVGTGQGISNSLTGAGNAVAGAATGAANALTGGVNTALQYSMLAPMYQAYSNMLNGGVGPGIAVNPGANYLTSAIATNNPLMSSYPGASAYMNGFPGG